MLRELCYSPLTRAKNELSHSIPLNFPLYVLAAKPQVLLVGQYSVGKTSFIKYLLGRDFPGQRIGPEPTTDRFTGAYRSVTFLVSLKAQDNFQHSH